MFRLFTSNVKRVFHQKSRFSSTSTNQPRNKLEGKIALITGGASGLGKATAHEFIQQGAHVYIADIDTKLGPEAVHDLGPRAHYIPCDVSVEAQVAQAIGTAMAQHGKLDIMYNNAGIPGPQFPPSIMDLDLDQFDKVMRINVRGTMTGIKHAARVMIPAGSGSILCTGSVSGLMGGLGPYPYAISKFTIPGIVKCVATELCQHGIRINCISPSAIPTQMVIEQFRVMYQKSTGDELREIIFGLGALNGAKNEEIDVAKAALYLASDDAKYVTGHNLVIDGGFTCFKHLNLPSLHQ